MVSQLTSLHFPPPSADNHATNALLLSTVVSIALFSSLLLGSLLLLGGRSAEHAVATSFLEIEWQVCCLRRVCVSIVRVLSL